jgi:hypothetical protein
VLDSTGPLFQAVICPYALGTPQMGCNIKCVLS